MKWFPHNAPSEQSDEPSPKKTSVATHHSASSGITSRDGGNRGLKGLLFRLTGPDGPVDGEMTTLSYYVLLLSTMALLVIGLVMVFSARVVSLVSEDINPFTSFIRYLIFAVAGVAGMWGISRMSISWIKRIAPIGLIIAIVLQGLVFVPHVGICVYGNCNWIAVPGIGTAQPSELVKLGVALCLGLIATWIAEMKPNWKRSALVIFIVVGIPVVSVLAGGDLGTVIVMVLLVAAGAWMGGLGKAWFISGAVVGSFGVGVLTMLSANRRARINAWLHPELADPTGVGYQPKHGMWALATGGLTGVGPGSSRQKWGYLTQADSDYIYAVLGEEFGLVGTLLVLVLFIAIGASAMRIIRRSNDLYVSVVGASITAWIIGQALINIMVVVGLLPVLGVPLPLVSAGGSALVSVLLAIGVLLAFARHEPGAQQALESRSSSMAKTLAVTASRRKNRA
ncbi:peptidoglycan glycosyltransferase FtsW [Actinomyces vulturis]|uniref:peptidoglycan glycosyltransferase FtsW n=1 Tax=Actinomyces vulturis TaxID=1857645 RepID=UPI0009F609BC|nr:putative peptidoglycan glycosyltransferase FtsW [Actinomyces vulturis]